MKFAISLMNLGVTPNDHPPHHRYRAIEYTTYTVVCFDDASYKRKDRSQMTYSIEIKDGHHIVDMAPQPKSNEPVETILEVLKFMTGYKAVEVFAETLNDYRGIRK